MICVASTGTGRVTLCTIVHALDVVCRALKVGDRFRVLGGIGLNAVTANTGISQVGLDAD